MSFPGSIEKSQWRRLVAVLALTGSFCAVETVLSFVAKSAVLKADALHLAMDVSALAMSLFAMRIASAAPSDRFTFGLHRAEPLAAVVNALLVLVGTVYLVTESIESLSAKRDPLVDLMAIVSTGALVVNGASAWLLHGVIGHAQHGHDHRHGRRNGDRDAHEDHDHDHDHGALHHEYGHGHRDHSMNLRGAWLHVLGDTLGSIAALATAGAIRLGAPTLIDPLASFLVAVFLFLGAGRLLRDASQVLLEGAPARLAAGIVREVIRGTDGVDEVVDLRVWTIGAGKDAAAARVRGRGEATELARRIESRLRDDLHVAHVWVHVERAEA